MATIGISDFLKKTYRVFDFDGEWADSYGTNPESNFKCLIYGESGQGKTEKAVRFAKYLTKFGKVYFNSHEQKHGKSLQDAIVRNNYQEVVGRVVFGDGEPFEKVKYRLKQRNSPSICFLDSRDYMNLTAKQAQELFDLFPKKAFVITCWSQGNKPKGTEAQAILYMVDMKVKVKNFRAEVRSRFGGGFDYVIRKDVPQGTTKGGKAGTKPEQSSLFDTQLDAVIPTIKA